MFGYPSLQHAFLSEVVVAPMRKVGDIAVINICHVIDALRDANLYPQWNEFDVSSEEKWAIEQAWCEAHGAVLYEAPREHFSYWSAYELAVDSGKGAVVVSDLS